MDSSVSSDHSADQTPYNMGQSPYWPSVVSATLAAPPVPEAVDGSFIAGVIPHGRAGGVGVMVAALFIVAEMAGAGILNLPSAISQTGWYGMVLMLILGVCVAFGGTRLSECWIILEEQWPEYRLVNRSPYPAIAYRAFGKPARWVLTISLHVTLLGASVVYLLLIADMLAELLQLIGGNFPVITSCEAIFIVGAVIIPLSWMGSPKDFWWTPFIAVGSTVATVAVVLYYIRSDALHEIPQHDKPTFFSFFLGSSSILFSLGGASMFPTIQNDMRNRDKFSHSVVISFIGLLTMYASIATSVYMILGSAAPPNIIDAVDGVSASVVQALLVAHFLFAYIITVNPSMQDIEDAMGIERTFGWQRATCRTVITIFLMLLGLLIPNFNKLLDLIGGSTVTLMSFIFPPIFYMKLARMIDPTTNKFVREVKVVETVVLVSMVVVGVVGGSVSSYSAMLGILSPDSFNSTCFSAKQFLGY